MLKLNESESKNLFELIHKRRKKSSSIFCSQFREEGWYERLGGDDNPLADAIMDRIVYDAYKINIESIDPSFRGKELKDPDYSRDSALNSLVLKPLIHESETYDAIARMLGKGIAKMDELFAEVQEFKKSRAEKKKEKTAAREHDREEVHSEMPLGVSVAEKEFRYGDDAFKDYAKKTGLDEKKPAVPEPPVPEKKPLKK